MLLIVAGRTAPNRAVRFGGERDGLDGRGRRDIESLAGALDDEADAWQLWHLGPEVSVQETGALLARHAINAAARLGSVDPGLADPRLADPGLADHGLASLDVGAWRGLTPEQVPGAELAAWFGDPTVAPHGGEPVQAFVSRIRVHVSGLPAGAALIVAKPVAQALLCAGAADFLATDVRHASVHRIDAAKL